MKRALFIDRDGTLIVEPPVTEQVNNLDELEFIPGVIRNLYFLRQKTDFELVIVSNQDGLGTSAYPQENFDTVQAKMLQVFKGEGIRFDNILIDKSRKEDNLPTRKPGTGMLTAYMNGDYDLAASYVIGDRATDAELAANLGCKAIILGSEQYPTWDKITEVIFAGERTATVSRKTKETDINISLNLDGNGKTDISTGLGFFDHMLEQIGKHSGIDLTIDVKGDLNVDEHHTMEDTAIALGEALYKALGDKRGIERYGFCLPMDDCLCSVAMDLGGRPWLVWDVKFSRDMIGDTPTEMFLHFFKSLSDNAKMNLNIKAEGDNEHHKIEGVFKAFARALKCAIKRDIYNYKVPSTKGNL
ncbi:MAG: bifunctional histidinol-phosphatase/imidazoleglycerol-phosphate dehydratase HisB [Paludibacteraceae bacterium]|nr:bifunctional histidinol-phosphatase/imidazoleglycerol-phosphate dehydratase HisB [Paludibacteraceae bacterium]